ncbi:hypothetical protein PoB_006782600 [Plakobranchus ocellatus]|uniref:Uncharacterized protein n=1 Tax=Plakobranchus ocellatus TaxID=259542 RepID=A0AAV4DB12_9GAST|nr:hypothetical protein PoB_006782600 [Plakobranchus ocellatus]
MVAVHGGGWVGRRSDSGNYRYRNGTGDCGGNSRGSGDSVGDNSGSGDRWVVVIVVVMILGDARYVPVDNVRGNKVLHRPAIIRDFLCVKIQRFLNPTIGVKLHHRCPGLMEGLEA